jgi:hypothetical protein
MKIDRKLTTHKQTIAEEFNSYYVSVANNITNDNPEKKKTLLMI